MSTETYTFADGKYTVVNDNGNLTLFRNGEPWNRDVVGDNLIYWMFVEALRLKADLDAARGPVVREHFEDQCMTLMRLKRENGKHIGADNGCEITRESLFWRKPNGEYGVEMFNAAWQGYQWGAQR